MTLYRDIGEGWGDSGGYWAGNQPLFPLDVLLGVNLNWIYETVVPYWIIHWEDSNYVRIEPNTPEFDRRDKPDDAVPVGSPDFQSDLPDAGIELSHLVIAEQTPEIFGETGIALSDEQWFRQMFPGKPYVPPQVAPPIPPPIQPLVTPVEDWIDQTAPETDMPLHEEIFDDLGDAARDWVRGQIGLDPVGYNPVTSLPIGPGGGGGGQPPVIINQGGCGPSGPAPVWKQVCGVYKWVTPKRRRRRALLTESDYNALLRIENLKVNKNMSVAIAKALTR